MITCACQHRCCFAACFTRAAVLTTVPQGWYRNIVNNQLEKQERGLDTKFMMPAMFLHGGRR
jgi:hypothetical protein